MVLSDASASKTIGKKVTKLMIYVARCSHNTHATSLASCHAGANTLGNASNKKRVLGILDYKANTNEFCEMTVIMVRKKVQNSDTDI